jgi:hypothetical protein
MSEQRLVSGGAAQGAHLHVREGAPDQGGGIVALGQLGDAGPEGDLEVAIACQQDRGVAEQGAETFGRSAGLERGRIVDHQAEAIVLQARGQVLGAGEASKGRAERRQHPVADGIAVQVIDLTHLGHGDADHRERATGARGLLDQMADVGVQEAMAVQPGQAVRGRGKPDQTAAQMPAQALLAHPGLDAQAQHLRVERLEQHVRDAPGERLGAIREMVGAAYQHDRQIEQLGVAADRDAQALQVVVIVAGGDQCDVEIVTMQALDRGIGGLGIGRRGGPAKGGQDLDLIASGQNSVGLIS